MSRPAFARPGFRVTVLCVALLTGLGLAYYLALVQSINGQKIVTGEEASVSFLDVVFLELRYQHNRFCTNIGGHLLFWIGSFLTPGHSLFWFRSWKAFLMSALPPLTFLFFVHRLRLSWQASLFGSLSLILLPGVTAYAWIGIECGLDMIFGVLALYLAMSSRYSVRLLGSVAMGAGLLVYGGALMYLPAFVCALVAAAIRRGFRSCLVELTASGLIIAAILGLPFLWWHGGGVIIAGGGSLDFDEAGARVQDLLAELFIRPNSYYFFSNLPAFIHWSTSLIIALGIYLAARARNVGFGLLVVTATCTVVAYSVTGGIPGFRRALSLNILMAGALAVVADTLIGHGKRSPLSITIRPALAAMFGVLLFAGWQQWSAYRAGSPKLPVDFSFLEGQGDDMAAALWPFIARQRDSTFLWDEPKPLRMICMINVMQRRIGLPPTLPNDAIRRYFLTRDTERYD